MTIFNFLIHSVCLLLGIAYAVVAGLDPQYGKCYLHKNDYSNRFLSFTSYLTGLYSEFMACSLYCIFGTCKELTIGPTAIMALMIHKFVVDSQDFAVIIAFLSGIVILVLGFLNLGS